MFAMSRRAIIGRMAMPAFSRSSLIAVASASSRRTFVLMPSIPQRSINADELRQRIKTVPDQRIRDLLSKIADNPQALETMHKITIHAVENKYIDPSNPTSPPSVFQIIRDQKMLALLQEMMAQLAKAGIAQTDLPVLMQGLFSTKFSTAAAPAPVSASSGTTDAAVLGERKAADNGNSAKPASLMDKVKNLFK